ncbi:HAD family hydrolase [Nocardia camponoti]|uniref:HAD family hydrolase n=1 Tax=Nocardia camponoti TaxID=1616106 RepID=A0A917VA83_9NOCA|nr:HAD family hydrolase [Nocardia camponoti]GGK53796.1 hypothetical protein GCM10011591_27000 [Nocardia camponoti]
MSALIATDLDRTMIYSRNGFAGDESAKLCVEYYEGEPLSYMTLVADARLRELSTKAVVVPTTTRTIEQFRRIALPGAPWRFAVTSNGGNILVDGEPDLVWRKEIATRVRAQGATLAEVGAELRSRISDDWVLKYREADDLFCYLVVNLETLPPTFLAEWDAWCRENGWTASQQGRKIYAMPDAVSKGIALSEVRTRLRDAGTLPAAAPFLAAGDGALDIPMLELADKAIRPRHGELEHLAYDSPTLTVTASTGIAASEEILTWFAGQAN